MGQGANFYGLSTNKKSSPEESRYSKRQKAAKNNPNLLTKISAYKMPLTIFSFFSSK